MSTLRSTHRLFVPTLITAAVVAACGGGGGGGSGSELRDVPDAAQPAADGADTTMSCVGGNTENSCSGDAVLRTDNGVRMTRSGVFVYGKSTTDNPSTPNDANGLDPLSAQTQAVTEIRVHRQASGQVDRAAMLLDQLGISWNGTDERPRIIEAFDKTTGMTQLDVNGTVDTTQPLPAGAYFDYVPGVGGTLSHYANNRYFGCPPTPPCLETDGVSYVAGDFRASGNDPDRTTAHRKHSDGDVRAPAGMPPDSKGFRDLTLYSYLDANLAAWGTKDTAFIDEWTPPSVITSEYSTRRLGAVAFGNTTPAASVPTTGEGTFRGIVYGWYSANGTSNATVYLATARIVVNFERRQADVYVEGAAEEQPPKAAVPAAFVSRAAFGAAGTNVANYLKGTVDTGGAAPLTGGLGARFFGAGSRSATEIAGSFQLKNATTGAAAVGGFIARR